MYAEADMYVRNITKRICQVLPEILSLRRCQGFLTQTRRSILHSMLILLLKWAWNFFVGEKDKDDITRLVCLSAFHAVIAQFNLMRLMGRFTVFFCAIVCSSVHQFCVLCSSSLSNLICMACNEWCYESTYCNLQPCALYHVVQDCFSFLLVIMSDMVSFSTVVTCATSPFIIFGVK